MPGYLAERVFSVAKDLSDKVNDKSEPNEVSVALNRASILRSELTQTVAESTTEVISLPVIPEDACFALHAAIASAQLRSDEMVVTF